MPDELWRKFKHEFPKEHEREVRELLGRHQEIFDGNGPLKQMRFATHDLKLTCEKPFLPPPYHYSAEKKKAIQQQVTEMLAEGVMDAKKDGRYRFCDDYRLLNSITEDSAQPKRAGKKCTQLIGQDVLAGLMRECYMHYLDDVCIYSRSWPEHLVHLAKVFERFSTHVLMCAVEKCSFGKRILEFLGHVIAAERNEANPEEVRAFLEAPTPL
jgi:hypothetical protein